MHFLPQFCTNLPSKWSLLPVSCCPSWTVRTGLYAGTLTGCFLTAGGGTCTSCPTSPLTNKPGLQNCTEHTHTPALPSAYVPQAPRTPLGGGCVPHTESCGDRMPHAQVRRKLHGRTVILDLRTGEIFAIWDRDPSFCKEVSDGVC